MMEATPRPRPSGSFTDRDLGDEFLLYDAGHDRVHVLNGTAREIYLLCDGSRSIPELAALLSERYDVESDRAIADIRETVGRLTRLGILE